jgi:dTMP kinase
MISFEGIDGVGKTTQVKRIMQELTYRGYKVATFREPGGTAISEKIRGLLLDVQNGSMAPVTEALLYAAARAQLVQEVLIPWLEQGTIVIADRFIDSTIAYQGYGRGLDINALTALNRMASGGLEPVITILLDMDAGQALQRRYDGAADRLEIEGSHFLERVRQGYLQIADQSSRFRVIDGNQESDRITREILQTIAPVVEGLV